MALKKCRECGKEVSSQAKVCMNCGIKNPAGGISFAQLFIFSFIAYMIYIFASIPSPSRSPAKANEDEARALRETAAREIQERKDAAARRIQEIKARKTLCKNSKEIEPFLPQIIVRSEGNRDYFVNQNWGKLLVDQKQGVAIYLSECYQNGGVIVIHDAYTGGELAKYSALGFKVYEK